MYAQKNYNDYVSVWDKNEKPRKSCFTAFLRSWDLEKSLKQSCIIKLLF